MLVTSKELFKKAQEGKFAIPAPNFIDLESLRWHVETAERHNPVSYTHLIREEMKRRIHDIAALYQN